MIHTVFAGANFPVMFAPSKIIPLLSQNENIIQILVSIQSRKQVIERLSAKAFDDLFRLLQDHNLPLMWIHYKHFFLFFR